MKRMDADIFRFYPRRSVGSVPSAFQQVGQIFLDQRFQFVADRQAE